MTIQIPLNHGSVALIDDEDLGKVLGYTWYCRSGYAMACIGGRKAKQTVRMHRLIMDAPPGVEVDHRNGNRLDNRKENLRLASRQQNAANRPKSNGVSKYKGVTPDKYGKRWRAQIRDNGINRPLGTYDTELIAAVVYDQKARELFKEFARPNFTDQEFAELWSKYRATIESPKKRKGTSKYPGVSWSTNERKWKAQQWVNGYPKALGTYTDEETAWEAVQKWRAAHTKYHR